MLYNELVNKEELKISTASIDLVKDLAKFVIGNLNRHDLQFHYLRVGKAQPLLDDLRDASSELECGWDQHETETFADYHFGQSYGEYDGAIINLGINDENVSEMRRRFWEEYIWKTEKMALPVALVVPDTKSFGSLTLGQVSESLSLVRLTDRPYRLFENKGGVVEEVVDYLTGISSVIHRKKRIEEENLDQS